MEGNPAAEQAPPRDIHVWAPSFRKFGGGIAAFSRELALALEGQGHRLALCGRDDDSQAWRGHRVIGTGGVPARLRKMAFAMRLMALVARRRPGLVVCTHVNFSPVAALAKRVFGVPYVVVAHGIDIHEGLTSSRKRALQDADAVWAVSRWTRDRTIQAGVAPERVRLVSNTVDDGRFDVGDPDPSLLRKYGIAPGEKVVLTVARLDPAEQYKGCDAIVRGLPRVQARVGPVRYLVAGGGEDRARVEQLAIALGVSTSVTFCGFVADADLPHLYRLADVFAMPSRGEGFGIVFLESMACGTPVLGGNQDGTRDALADGALGALVDPADAVAIARELQRLLEGQGPALWFDPRALREACLAAHGRPAFGRRVSDAMASLHGDMC